MLEKKSAAGGFHKLTTDMALGAAGFGLAVASASFGVFMTVHGPVASFGTSKDFTVFAQLAPRSDDMDTPKGAARRPSTKTPQELDLTETASISSAYAVGAEAATIIPSVVLTSATSDEATVTIDSRARIVHVGDALPGAGKVLAIIPGRKPMVRTSLGLIVSDRGN